MEQPLLLVDVIFKYKSRPAYHFMQTIHRIENGDTLMIDTAYEYRKLVVELR